MVQGFASFHEHASLLHPAPKAYNPLMHVDKALEHWENEGLLTPSKVHELRASLHHHDAAIPGKAISAFTAIGGVLIGLGVILFVASNWNEMAAVAKVLLLVIGMLVSGVAGYVLAWERDMEKTGLAVSLVNILIFGASMFLVGQIYHLPFTLWWVALLWWLGTAYFAVVLRSRLHAWLSVPLFLLFVGWARSTAVTGFGGEMDFLSYENGGILGIMPLLGGMILSLGMLARSQKACAFCAATLQHWGWFLVILPIVVSTAEKSMLFLFFRFTPDVVSLPVAAAALAALLCALSFGTFTTPNGKAGMIALFAYIAFVILLAHLPGWFGFPVQSWYGSEDFWSLTGLYILHVAMAVVFLLTSLWYGTLMRAPAVVNMAILGIAFVIVFQYFSWVFSLFDRSFAFILGGLLILGIGTLLERKRRSLLATMHV